MQNNQCDFNIIEKILIRLDLELNDHLFNIILILILNNYRLIFINLLKF